MAKESVCKRVRSYMEKCVLAFKRIKDRQRLMKEIIILLVSCYTAFLIGCGAKTEQRFGVIAVAERDRALINFGNIEEIRNGKESVRIPIFF